MKSIRKILNKEIRHLPVTAKWKIIFDIEEQFQDLKHIEGYPTRKIKLSDNKV